MVSLETSVAGIAPPSPPRITARIVSPDGPSGISSRALVKEGRLIEYQPTDTTGQLLRLISLDAGYLERVKKVRAARLPTRTILETLCGKITAIDLNQETFQLRLEGSPRRIKGSFSRLLHPTLVTVLGQRVRLHGEVTRRGRAIVLIKVQQVEPATDG
jgi:hypothetical protein